MPTPSRHIGRTPAAHALPVTFYHRSLHKQPSSVLPSVRERREEGRKEAERRGERWTGPVLYLLSFVLVILAPLTFSFDDH